MITWLKEKGAKTLQSVAAFLCKAAWIQKKMLRSERQNTFWEKSSDYSFKMWHRFDVS